MYGVTLHAIVYLVQILVVVAIILLRELIHRRLKRSRFPCEQYLDMGKSVLTPEEILLGKAWSQRRKAGRPVSASCLIRQWGKGNSGQHSETCLWGTSGVSSTAVHPA